jgi:hypothetical protein
MSEQPQEWTPEMVTATLKDRPYAASTIASAHNAALAAEQEEKEDWRQGRLSCERQLDATVKELAAEQEKIKRLTDAINKPHPSVYELRALLLKEAK